MPRTSVVGTTAPSGSGAQRCAQAGEGEHRTDSTARPATEMATGARHRRRPEDAIQRAVFQQLRARAAPNVFAFHPANGGYRKPIEAAIMKGMGVMSGVPDVIAIHEGRCYALEIKAPGGRATPKQLETIAAMEAAGAFTAIAEGLDRALAVLEAWKLLRGHAS
jgi:hypothetical protein